MRLREAGSLLNFHAAAVLRKTRVLQTTTTWGGEELRSRAPKRKGKEATQGRVSVGNVDEQHRQNQGRVRALHRRLGSGLN
ncbi:MAG: hypothetical protein QOG43_2182 [Actinomycetota bacterium]|jgi:hypothetical protein|nr:hypothetical protein [Actinomycetota bacterium]